MSFLVSALASARSHLVDNRYRLLRYGWTSAVGVVLGQTILRVCYDLLGWSALVSNLVAFLIANIPVYHLNRSWVWDRSGPSSWRREVLPFWLVSFAGLALSSLAVGLIDRVTDNGWFITVASVGAFGTVWLVKYAVCDQLLFGPPDEGGDRSRFDGRTNASIGPSDEGGDRSRFDGRTDISIGSPGEGGDRSRFDGRTDISIGSPGEGGSHDADHGDDHDGQNRGMAGEVAGDGARPAGVR